MACHPLLVRWITKGYEPSKPVFRSFITSPVRPFLFSTFQHTFHFIVVVCQAKNEVLVFPSFYKPRK